VHLVEDHQPVGMICEIQLRLGDLGLIGFGLQVQVEGVPLFAHC